MHTIILLRGGGEIFTCVSLKKGEKKTSSWQSERFKCDWLHQWLRHLWDTLASDMSTFVIGGRNMHCQPHQQSHSCDRCIQRYHVSFVYIGWHSFATLPQLTSSWFFMEEYIHIIITPGKRSLISLSWITAIIRELLKTYKSYKSTRFSPVWKRHMIQTGGTELKMTI